MDTDTAIRELGKAEEKVIDLTDELTRLRALNRELVEALENICKMADSPAPSLDCAETLLAEILRAGSAVLAKAKEG